MTKAFHRKSLQIHKEAKKAFAIQIPEIYYLKSLQTHKELKQTFARKHNQSDGEHYQTNKESRIAYAKKYRQKT